MKMFKKAMKYGTGAALTAYGVAANAAVDVTAVTTGVSESQAAVLLVGAAVTLVIVGIKTYKWINRSL
jgi:hypothetical protein